MYSPKIDIPIKIGDVGVKTYFKDKVMLSYRMINDNPFNKYRLMQLVIVDASTKKVLEVLGERAFTEKGETIITNQAERNAAFDKIRDLEISKSNLDPSSPTFSEDAAAIDEQIAAVVVPEPITKTINTYDEIIKVFNQDGTLTEFGKTWLPDNVSINGVPITAIVDIP